MAKAPFVGVEKYPRRASGDKTRRAPEESEKLKSLAMFQSVRPGRDEGWGLEKPGFLFQGLHFRIAARGNRENRRPSGNEALARRKYAVSRDLKGNSHGKFFSFEAAAPGSERRNIDGGCVLCHDAPRRALRAERKIPGFWPAKAPENIRFA